MNKIKLVFCGTPNFAEINFERILKEENFSIEMVVTQPDRPAGRGLEMKASPVKQVALKNNLNIKQPEKIKEIYEDLKAVAPDIIVVVAYGEFLPKSVLDIPKFGCINVHPSLLPRWRGAAPVNHALLNGDKVTGVSTMFLTPKMDAGDVIYQEKYDVKDEDTAETLLTYLAERGSELLVKTINDLYNGKASRTVQDESLVTFASLMKKEDGEIDFENESAINVFNKYRAFKPWPGVYSHFNGKKVKFTDIKKTNEGFKLSPGEFDIKNNKFYVGTKDGNLEIGNIQLEGKKAVLACDFVNGLQKNVERKFKK